MQNVGSLADFIEVKLEDINYNPIITSSKMEKNPNNARDSEKVDLHFSRMKSVVDEYVACDKSKFYKKKLLSKRIATEAGRKSELSEYDKYLKRREWMSENKFSLFPITEPKLITPQLKLKREQRLLRAAKNIKRQQKQKQLVSQNYEKSYDNLSKSLNRLNRQNIFGLGTKKYGGKLSENIVVPQEKRSGKKKLSSQKRVEYERCLEWAKKRKKHEEHYRTELGKDIKKANLQMSARNRKKILKSLKEKSFEL